MYTRIQPVLDLLDQGLLLYRRHVVRFVLLSALWLVPVTIGIGLSIAAMQYWSAEGIVLMVLAWMLLMIPLTVYLVGALSRAALAAIEERPVRLREALGIGPLRLAGMGCYSVIFFIIVNVVTSALSLICVCPLYTIVLGSITGAGIFLDSDTGWFGMIMLVIIGVVSTVLTILFYGMSLVLSGIAYSSVVYAVQPFVQGELPLRRAIEYSIDLLFYRFGRNVLAFALCSTIFAAVSLSVTLTIGLLLPLPLFWALGSESLATQIISAIAWLVGLVVVLPPMPIWMALLYRRNFADHQGSDLARRIAALSEPTGPEAA
jgi:hypothetical protein